MIQLDTTRRREWKRRAEVYRRYVAAIAPMVPQAVYDCAVNIA